MEREELIAVIKGDIGDFKQKMAQVSQTTTGIADKFNKLTSGLFKVGLASAAAYGALEAFKKVTATSSEASDKLEFAVASVTGGLKQMGRQLVTLDFSNFTDNIKQAAEVSRDLAERLDDLQDRNRSLSIMASETNAMIAALREDAADPDTSITQASRIADIKEAIRLQGELSKVQLENAERTKKIAAERLEQETGLSELQLQAYYRNYNNIEDLRLEANKLMEDYDSWVEMTDKESADRLLQKALNGGFINLKGELVQTTELVAQMMLQMKKLGKGSDTAIDDYINALVRLGEITEEDSRKMKMLNRQLKGLKPEETHGTEDIPNRLLNDKDYFLIRKKQIEQLKVPIDNLRMSWQQFGDTVERYDIKNSVKEIKQVIIDIGKELEYLVEGALVSFAEGLGAIAVGGSLKNSLDNMLLMFADWASNLGKVIIAAGLAIEGIKKWAISNPIAAVGLGIALVAAAAAIKGAVNRSPVGNGGGISSGSGGGGSDWNVTGQRNLRGAFEIQVSGVLTGKGSELQAVLNNEAKRKVL